MADQEEKIIAAPSTELWFTEATPESGFKYSLRIDDVLHREQTPYQRLEVFETSDFGRALVLDGFVNVSQRDNFFYHEVMAHPALFIHDAPKRVLIIGGGDCGVLREVLRHDGVEHVDMIEIDERVVEVSKIYFPELTEANDDPRGHIRFVDGIKWVAETEPGFYDVIVVDSTDPVGPAAELFSEEFYANCFRALGDGGMVVVQSESPIFHLNILKSIHGKLRRAGFQQSHAMLYPTVVYGGGTWSSTIARKNGSLKDFREEDARGRNFPTRYYNEEVHRGLMATPEYMKDVEG